MMSQHEATIPESVFNLIDMNKDSDAEMRYTVKWKNKIKTYVYKYMMRYHSVNNIFMTTSIVCKFYQSMRSMFVYLSLFSLESVSK